MKKKPTILIFSHYFIPGFKGGGPIVSINNLISVLSGEYNFKVITTDRDIGENQKYLEIKSNEWNYYSNTYILYLKPRFSSYFKIINNLKNIEYDFIYLNSFFDFKFSIFIIVALKLGIILRKPILIATRGELEPGALKIKSIKKNLFIFISKCFKLHKRVFWQATCISEGDQLVRIMKINNKNLFIASNFHFSYKNMDALIHQYNYYERVPLKLCFISRITEKKNLKFAIEIINKVKNPLIFDIYGPIENNTYWLQCKELINKCNNNKTINYKGILNHNEVIKTFMNYDLFFFPTLSENFGHVIIESMIAGTPVLISNNTPWKNLNNIGVGWDFSLNNPELFIETINNLFTIGKENHKKLRERTQKFADEYIASNNESMVKTYKDIFNSILDNGFIK